MSNIRIRSLGSTEILTHSNHSQSQYSKNSSKLRFHEEASQSRIWEDLPRHLRIKKKTTYIRRHSDMKIATTFTIVRLLMWKNFVVMKRQWKTSLLQYLTPLAIIIVMLIIHINTEEPGYNDKVYDYFHVDTFDKAYSSYLFGKCESVYLTPKNPVMEELRQQLEDAKDNFKYKFLTSSSSTSQLPADLCLQLEFHKKSFGDRDGKQFSDTISYSLRFRAVHSNLGRKRSVLGFGEEWETKIMYPDQIVDGVRAPKETEGGHPGYYKHGFLHFQHKITNDLMRMILKQEQFNKSEFDTLRDKITVRLRRMPFPAHPSESRLVTISATMPICLVGGFTISCSVMAYLSVREREMGVKQVLKIYGIHEVLVKYTWILHNFFYQSISALLMTIILSTNWKNRSTTRALFDDNFYSSIFFLLLLCYIFNVICTIVLLTCFFQRASTACITVCLLWILFFLPYHYTHDRLQKLDFHIFESLLLCIPCNTALGFGCQLLAKIQADDVLNLEWKSIFTQPGQLNHVWIVVMLLGSGVLQVLIAQYISRVFNDAGVQKLPWNFLCKAWFWKDQHPPDPVPPNLLQEISFEISHPANFEDDSHTKQRKELCIENLSKYHGLHRILHRVNLICYQGHATVILGDKGCGKSSLLQTITGALSLSGGTIYLSRKDLAKYPAMSKAFVGYCASENVLFPDFTVAETLDFFTALKSNCTRIEVYEEVERILKLIKMSDFRDTVVSELTKSSQRMVMIATAFCGGSRVVLLDEPSTGLSQSQQNILWEFIANEKRHRTVLMGMDSCHEIDSVVDKIVLMHYGQLTAKGSPEFLKTKFGGGYHLELEVQDNLDITFVKDLIRRRIDSSSIYDETDTLIDFYLPQSKSPAFPGLLSELESMGSTYGVVGFKMRYVTLEELHLKLKRLSTSLDDENIQFNIKSTEGLSIKRFKTDQSELEDSELRHGPELFNDSNPMSLGTCNEVLLMFLKNFRYSIRNRLQLFASTVLTLAILVIFVFCADVVQLKNTSHAALKMDFNDLPNPYILTDIMRSTNEGFYMRDAVNEVVGPLARSVDYENNEDIVKKMLIEYNIEQNESDVGFFGVEIRPTRDSPNERYKVGITGYFNNQPLHTPPMALALVDKILLKHFESYLRREVLPTYRIKGYTMEVINHPLDYQPDDFVKHSQLLLGPGYFFGMFTSFSYSFLLASFIIMHIKEQEFRSMQFAFGANQVIFWGTNYLYNFLHFTVVAVLHALVLFVMTVPGTRYVDLVDGLRLVLHIFFFTEIFGFTGVCIVGSCASFKFKGWGIGFSKLVLSFIVTGPLLMMILILIEEYTEGNDIMKIFYYILSYIFMIFPGYAYGHGLYQLIANEVHLTECPAYDLRFPLRCSNRIIHVFNEFSHDGTVADSCCYNMQNNMFALVMYGIGRNVTVLAVISVGCIFHKAFFHTKTYRRLKKRWLDKRSRKWNPFEVKEAVYNYDVLVEEAKIYKGEGTHDLTVKNLTLETPQYTELDNISLGIGRGECLGFLGSTGAGKTTFLKTLMGYEYLPTYGEVHFRGLSLVSNYPKYIRHFSCCLDYNQFLEELKGEEVLRLMGVLRGLSISEIEDYISTIGENMVMSVELDQPISTYTHVVSKKLSVAVAMMGGFNILLLDEPTNHLDAKSRAFVTKSVQNLLAQGCTVIWTSHGIEQCEAICTKMCILVNGHLKAIGTADHLQTLYQEGYTVIAKILLDREMVYFTSTKKRPLENHNRIRRSLDEEDAPTGETTNNARNSVEALLEPNVVKEFEMLEHWEQDLVRFVAFFERHFPDADLVDRQPGFLHYHVHSSAAKLSDLFTIMEEARLVAEVDSYYITISNLDQIFYNFTREQIHS